MHANIYSVKVLTLNENTMQLAVKHKTKNEYAVLNTFQKHITTTGFRHRRLQKSPTMVLTLHFLPVHY